MKKITSLLSAALVCLALSAQECPTKTMMYLLNGEDAANVEIELGLSENNSSYLQDFYFMIAKPEGANWNKQADGSYFTAHGYAPYIMALTTNWYDDEDNPIEVNDELLEEILYNCCDVMSQLKNDNLVVIEVLYNSVCRYYPNYPGKVGRFSIDMSGLEDGEYELRSENTPENGALGYGGGFGSDGIPVWQLDEPMVLTLAKQGNTVIEKGRQAASYVSSLSGISTIGADGNGDSRIYDLQGRELQSVPEHGVYIQNGKKYVK